MDIKVFRSDLDDGKCFRVDSETDLLSKEDYFWYEEDIKAADRKEIANFLKHKVFIVKSMYSATQRTMSCVWVRKWKRMPDALW